jgi:hypothetical protein
LPAAKNSGGLVDRRNGSVEALRRSVAAADHVERNCFRFCCKDLEKNGRANGTVMPHLDNAECITEKKSGL